MGFNFFKISIFSLFCLAIIVLQFLQIIYFQRASFIEQYDVEYWSDRYEHSQYTLPLSKRIIGDDGLYAYAGYKVIHGENPFSINVDKPPVGKYLFGFSILLFNNPIYIIFLLGIATLVFFYILARKVLQERSSALFVVTFLFLEPFFFTQLWKSWYDILQLSFLIISVVTLFFIRDSKKASFVFAFICGIGLIISSQIKPALLFPIIFILETLYFFSKRFKKQYLIFLLAICIGFFIPYFRYVQLGNGILDILRVQKYMASFYLGSGLKVHPEAMWQTIFLGRFPDIVMRIPIEVSEWWFLLPVTVLLAIGGSITFFFKKTTPLTWKGFSIFVLIGLIIFSTIPSYPRYIIILLPFLYLISVKTMEDFISKPLRMFIFSAVLMYGVVHSTLLLLPSPNALLDTFYYSFTHQYFQDIYQENLAKSGKPTMSRDEFRFLSQKTLENATVRAINVSEPQFVDTEVVQFKVTYKTQDLGSFEEQKTMRLIQEQGQWKIVWDWDLLLNDFSPTSIVETKLTLGKRGDIRNAEGKVLAEDALGYLVSINPEKLDTKRESELLKLLESYSHQSAISLQNAYLENSLPGEDIPLVTFNTLLNENEKNYLLSLPGVTLREYPTRIFKGIDQNSIKNIFYEECCTRIYSSYNYHGINGLEKEYDTLLSGYSGGKILLKDQNDRIIRVILEKKEKHGKDVILAM